MGTDTQICEVMRRLDIDPNDFVVSSAEQLAALKTRARKGLRTLAKTHHPDCTRDVHRIDLFKVAIKVVEDIENTEYVPKPVRRRKLRYSFTVTR